MKERGSFSFSFSYGSGLFSMLFFLTCGMGSGFALLFA